jgi:heme A synthase
MAVDDNNEPHDRMTPLLSILGRVGSVVGSIIASRAAQLLAIKRNELRRAAAVIALALAAAIFACAAAGFAAFSILVALGEEHRAAAAALIAGCFALLSGVAILLARGRPGDPPADL